MSSRKPRLKPAQLKGIVAAAQKFKREMDSLAACPKCGKARMTVSIGIGGEPMKDVTTRSCVCP